MWIHPMTGIADQHRPVGDPGRCSDATCWHIGGLIPIGQVLKQSCKLRRDVSPSLTQRGDALLLDGIVRSAWNHVEQIHFVSACRKEPKNLSVADVIELFRQWFR